MRALAQRRDLYFYPAAFIVWSAFILLRNMGFSYYGTPLAPVDANLKFNEAFYRQQTIETNIKELQESLKEEKRTVERAHIEHNIGTAFYDQYKASNQANLLDSAQQYYRTSILTLPSVGRFYYNIGRVFTERREHMDAKAQYEKTLELDPAHVLALHNLALLNFYELGNWQAADSLLKRALSIRPDLPICNYVLGEIALQQNRYDEALEFFRREVRTYSSLAEGKQNVPVSTNATRFAASNSYLQLAILYSTRFVDGKYAQANLHAYLRLEPDEQKRTDAIAEMKKYWVMKDQ
jgi:tetratricopeptide (TPR) repeat protein